MQISFTVIQYTIPTKSIHIWLICAHERSCNYRKLLSGAGANNKTHLANWKGTGLGIGHKPKTLVTYTTIRSIFKKSENQEKENKETLHFQAIKRMKWVYYWGIAISFFLSHDYHLFPWGDAVMWALLTQTHIHNLCHFCWDGLGATDAHFRETAGKTHTHTNRGTLGSFPGGAKCECHTQGPFCANFDAI